jgi:hypothetical protein
MTLIHNGYDIQFLDNMSEAEDYMNSIINNHLDLQPKRICDRKIKMSNTTSIRLVRFKYRTLYEEDFIIEFSDRHD